MDPRRDAAPLDRPPHARRPPAARTAATEAASVRPGRGPDVGEHGGSLRVPQPVDGVFLRYPLTDVVDRSPWVPGRALARVTSLIPLGDVTDGPTRIDIEGAEVIVRGVHRGGDVAGWAAPVRGTAPGTAGA